MPKKLPALKPKQVVTALNRAGFYIHHQTGSHIQLRHNKKPHLRVTVPFHRSFDLPPSVISSILKQSERTPEEFLKLL
ncbi:type II toxin-antitoxin system HicA family toxin [Patescibacteria group bacterium]|nr:type II toxin-antitoxin system HicA family toxin [Patescibacteria group bacterium]